VDTGGRSTFGLIVVPLAAAWLRSRPKASRARSLAAAGLAAALVIAALQLQLRLRTAIGQGPVATGTTWSFLTLDGTIDYFSETAFAVATVPDFHGYFHESALLQFVVTLIPRFLWQGKPVPEILPYYSFQRNGWDIYSDGGNLLPGIIGQQHMSWGWLGVVLTGFTLGWMVRRLDHGFAAGSGRTLFGFGLYVMCCTYVGLSYRYLAPGYLYPVGAAAVTIAIARRFAVRRRTSRP
jgi:hypothetical protein